MSDTHPLVQLETLVLIAIGGFAGANLRYFIGLFEPGLAGTLVANVSGAFLLGVLLYEAIYAGRLDQKTALVVGTGFLSSLTTYSTFAFETVEATPLFAAANVAGNYALGFGAVAVGGYVAAQLGGERK